MNVRDAESVAALLVRRGYGVAGEEDAELVIVNTCSVRGKAEAKALGKLGLLVAGRRGPKLIVGAMGCMVQRLGVTIFDKVPGLDFAVGTHRLARLPAVLDRVQRGGGPVLEAGDDGSADVLAGHADGQISAFVNILLGCNRRCAYCIVPSVRGSEWSRPADGVLEEVRVLARHGCREVTLLGQSVMAYGRTNPVWGDDDESEAGFKEPLPKLLEAVAAVPGIRRVRFTSGHPSGCTVELARAMAEVPAVCAHLHLPLQSGSDRILKRMRRGYTTAGYRAAVSRLRKAVPHVAISTDIIVGFPSETEEEFEMTREFMNEIGFDNAFVFKYSPRPGTPAADWHDDVSDDEKMRRNKLLLTDQDRRSLSSNRVAVGTIAEIMVEGPSARNAARWAGRTEGGRVAVFDPVEGLEVGDLAQVRVERSNAQTLYGQVMDPFGKQAACEACNRRNKIGER